jgi:hypothetical protein
MQLRATVARTLLLLTTAALLAFPHPANAQAVTGSIEGHVTDPSGAVVPSATVTIRNTDLGTARTIATSRDGAFRASGLISGIYTVDAKADKLALRRPVRIILTLGSSTEVALKLEIPRARESTTVRASAAGIEGNTVAPELLREHGKPSPFRRTTALCSRSNALGRSAHHPVHRASRRFLTSHQEARNTNALTSPQPASERRNSISFTIPFIQRNTASLPRTIP